MSLRCLTGIPHEHETPAPVTTNIFLHFATESDRLERRWRVVASDAASVRSSVVMGIAADGRVSLMVCGWRREREETRSSKRCGGRVEASDVDLHRVASRSHVIRTRSRS